jgi:hypothetical protein
MTVIECPCVSYKAEFYFSGAAMTAAQLHKRQWIITARAGIPQSYGFKSISLAPGLFLHYEPSLRVEADPTKKYIILGNPFGNIAGQKDAHYTAGRLVLIDLPWLSLNAAGLLGVYYLERPQEVICSSSVALISEITGQPSDTTALNWKRGINWDVLPNGPIPGLKKLYCDQALNLEIFSVAQRPRCLRHDLSEASAGDALVQYFADLMPDIGRRFPRIYLALTGGRDSRTLMSALLATGVQCEAFTWTFDAHSRQDAAIAKVICAKYGIVHHQIDAAGTNLLALKTYRRHTSGRIDDADTHHLVPGNYYRMFGRDDLILLGDGFEIGRRFYAQKFRRSPAPSDKLNDEIVALAFGEDKSERIRASLKAWLSYRETNPIFNMDLIDLFYLDQRLGGWQASICQGRDCLVPDFFEPANSWTCVDLLMATSPERRAAGVIQSYAMEKLVPGISKVGSWTFAAMKSKAFSATRSLVLDSPFENIARMLMNKIKKN